MHLIKRNILTVIQRPLKSLLILVIMTFLVSSMLSSYIVQDASSNLENSIKNRMGARAKIKTSLDLASGTYNVSSQYSVERQIKSAGKSRIKIRKKLRFLYLNDLKSLYYTIKSQIIIM